VCVDVEWEDPRKVKSIVEFRMGEAANLHDPISAYQDAETEGMQMGNDEGTEGALNSGAAGDVIDVIGEDDDESNDEEYIPAGPTTPLAENPTDGMGRRC
jgi:hypothetical protein